MKKKIILNWQVEDDNGIKEAHHSTEKEALKHALKLKKTSHRNRPVVISSYEPGVDNTYEIKHRL